MGKSIESPTIELLENIAHKCALAARRPQTREETMLFDRGVTNLRRVAALLRANLPIPNIEVFGPPVDLVQYELEEAGFEDIFGDFAVHKDVVFVANIYQLQNPLAFIRLLRVPMPDHEGETAQGLFSRRFKPERFRVE